LDSDLFKSAEALSQSMWPSVPVIPAMGAGATDSSFLRNAGIPMYGVSGLFVEAADYRTHGLNERIKVQRLYDGREFLYRLVKQLSQ
jgi:acetylornithine deacetylase/succinyl-diaminopimelate desuccinylase-like protein